MMGRLPFEHAFGFDDVTGGEPVDLGWRYRPFATFYRFDGDPIEATDYLIGMSTTSDLATPEGTFQLVLKASPIGKSSALEPVDWLEEVPPGSWVVIELSDGKRIWPLMLGNVDRVHRSISGVGGGRTHTYTVTGRDHGKALTKSEIVILPQFKDASAIDVGQDLQPYYRRLDRIVFEAGKGGVAPDEIIPRMLYFFLGHVTRGTVIERGAAPIWRMPPTLRIVPSGWKGTDVELAGLVADLPGDEGMPLGDLLEVHTEPLDGRLVLREVFDGLPDGTRLWELLAGYANTEINEVFVDLLPANFAVGRPMTVDDYVTTEPGATGWAPAMVVRRRPFPSEEYAKAAIQGFQVDPSAQRDGVTRWRDLPWTIIDERQLAVDETSRHDSERFNFFLAVPHADFGGNPYTMALGSSGRGKLPITVPESPRRYGWTKRQMSSPFLPTNPAVPTATYFVWSQALADWYERNPEYLSGNLSTRRALPGVRIGEKLTVIRNGGTARETYYVEGVTHEWQVQADGKESSSSNFTVTRGSTHPLGRFKTLAEQVGRGTEDMSAEEVEAYDILRREGAIQ